jgi:hypothetical protein
MAVALARAGFGTKLVTGLEHCSTICDANMFIVQWCHSLAEELITNTSGFLAQHQPTLAKSIPLTFPDLNIINLYLHPVTLQSQGGTTSSVGSTGREASLQGLAVFAEKHFLWGHTAGILHHFSTTIFPGLAIQQLMKATLARHLGLRNPGYSMLGPILSKTRADSRLSEGHHPEAHVSLVVGADIIDTVWKAIKGARATLMPLAMRLKNG